MKSEIKDNRKAENLRKSCCHQNQFLHQLTSTDSQSSVRSNDGAYLYAI